MDPTHSKTIPRLERQKTKEHSKYVLTSAEEGANRGFSV